MNPEYLDLIVKYKEGNPLAIRLVDTALSVAMDTAYLRGSDDERLEWLDYHDERMTLDMANDSIYADMQELNIEPPIKNYLTLLEKDNEEA
jgi:hypothetical protein